MPSRRSALIGEGQVVGGDTAWKPALQAASAASVDPNHPELSKAWQRLGENSPQPSLSPQPTSQVLLRLAYDLRAHRAFR